MGRLCPRECAVSNLVPKLKNAIAQRFEYRKRPPQISPQNEVDSATVARNSRNERRSALSVLSASKPLQILERSAIPALVCSLMQAGRDILLRHGSQVRVLPRSPLYRPSAG